MKELKEYGKRDPRLHTLVGNVLWQGGIPSKAERQEVECLFNYVVENVRYVKDPVDIETFQGPIQTLQMHRGDCDDMAILLAAMLENAGYRTRYRVIQTSSANTWSHVYVQVNTPRNDPSSWLSLDPTMPQFQMGWEAPKSMVTRSLNYPLSGLSGLSDFYSDNWFDDASNIYDGGYSVYDGFQGVDGVFADLNSLFKKAGKAQLPSGLRKSAAGKYITKRTAPLRKAQLPSGLRKSAAGKYITKKSRETERYIHRKRREWLNAADKMVTLSPFKKVLAWLFVGNVWGAYLVVKKHPDEVINEMPAVARDYVRNFKNNIDDILSRKKAAPGISGLGGELGFMGDLEGLSFKDMITKIRQSWDHLPRSRKNIIIGVLVILVIATAIIVIYASALVKGWLHVAGEVLMKVWTQLVSIFGKSGAWGLLMSFFTWIISLFNRHRGAPEAEATGDVPAEPPTSEELKAVGKPPGVSPGQVTVGAALLAALFLL